MIQNNLPENSRTWVYQSARKFTMAEVILLKQKINAFVAQWTSHNQKVSGWGDLLYDRFLILMADEEADRLGGCSVDSSVSFVKSLESEFHTNFLDRWNIAYKMGNEVLTANREDFSRLLEEGKVHDYTIVFNNLVQTKAELLKKWQVPYSDHWLKSVASTNTSFKSLL